VINEPIETMECQWCEKTFEYKESEVHNGCMDYNVNNELSIWDEIICPYCGENNRIRWYQE
jgi:uncharacterized Zn-finger protein